MKKLAVVAALAACVGLAQAQPYAAWTKYRTVTVNTTSTDGGANVATSQTNFPVLVRLTNTNEASGSDVLSEALAGGADIRFTDSTGNVAFAYEIDHWSANSAAIWVRVPDVAGNASTKIRMYWNRSGAPSASGNVFTTDDGFLGVWHMGNSATPTAPRPNAVAGGNAATPVNLTDATNPFKVGAIGMADTLRSLESDQQMSDYFDLGDGYADFEDGQVTLSMWVWRTHVDNSWNQFLSFGNSSNTDNIWMGKQGSGDKNFTFEVPPPTAHIHASGALANNENQWIHLLATNNKGASVLYVDGAQVQTGNTGTPTAVTRVQNYIARSVDEWPDRNLRGKVDEVRIANVYRSADWVKLEYETQKSGASAVTLGTTVTLPVPDLAYITKNATYLVNQDIQANTAVTSGTATGWSISPALPAGLSFNTSTGAITGKPTAASATATYTVTATVGGNTVTDNLTITVVTGTPPAAPMGVSAVAASGEATVSWNAGAAGTSPITSYVVTAVGDASKTCTWTEGPLSCKVTGLTNGTSYTFTVKAVSAVGESPASQASAAVIPAGAPAAPSDVKAVQASGTSLALQVSWTAPTNTGGMPITEYYVTGTPGGSCYAAAPSTNCTVTTGLTAGTAYTFTVIAVNGVGQSPASAPSAAVTPVGLAGSFAIHVSGAVKPYTFALTEEAMKSTSALTMSITDIHGRTVWSKTVNPSKDRAREVTWNGVSSTGRAVAAGVYMVRVSAVNDGKTSEIVRPTVK